jgi:hypothetical protein
MYYYDSKEKARENDVTFSDVTSSHVPDVTYSHLPSSNVISGNAASGYILKTNNPSYLFTIQLTFLPYFSTYFSSRMSISFHLFNLLFFRIFHIFPLFNLLFFHIFHIISLFNLLYFHIFHIFSLFNLLFFHIFQLTFLPECSYLFTIQLKS